jgi:hypothetical protein
MPATPLYRRDVLSVVDLRPILRCRHGREREALQSLGVPYRESSAGRIAVYPADLARVLGFVPEVPRRDHKRKGGERWGRATGRSSGGAHI